VGRDPLPREDQAVSGSASLSPSPLTAGLRRRTASLKLLCPKQARSRGSQGHPLPSAPGGEPRATGPTDRLRPLLERFYAHARGKFALTDVITGRVINPPIAGRWKFSWTLEQVEAYLNRPAE
jgi:hypothetical protein